MDFASAYIVKVQHSHMHTLSLWSQLEDWADRTFDRWSNGRLERERARGGGSKG